MKPMKLIYHSINFSLKYVLTSIFFFIQAPIRKRPPPPTLPEDPVGEKLTTVLEEMLKVGTNQKEEDRFHRWGVSTGDSVREIPVRHEREQAMMLVNWILSSHLSGN